MGTPSSLSASLASSSLGAVVDSLVVDAAFSLVEEDEEKEEEELADRVVLSRVVVVGGIFVGLDVLVLATVCVD